MIFALKVNDQKERNLNGQPKTYYHFSSDDQLLIWK